GGGLGPRGRPRAPAFLRGARLRQDDRHHAERPRRLPERPHHRPPHGDLRPPASLPAPPPRHDARLARGSAGMTIPVEALIDGLVTALEAIDALPPEAGGAARAAIAEHLAAQTMRDLAVLKPSLFGEISKG